MLEQWFENKVALVTGGADGIGRAAAVLYSQRGASVVVTDVNIEGAEETVDMIKSAGGRAIVCPGDVTSDGTVAAFVKSAVDTFGRLDCAFNNAGVCLPKDRDWDPQAIQKTIDVNLTGVMNCIRHEIPALRASGGGTIVNTASLAGFIASRTSIQPSYTATKHAVIGLTKSAALQYARENIRVNALCPGGTVTAMTRGIMAVSDEIREMMENLSPMGRMAEASEMAEAAIWLSSDKSSFVNAHALIVDGGCYAE
jgi:NAD(P)-dependent dehydrogenase (short-subunit alcohol dehydrogenase family)